MAKRMIPTLIHIACSQLSINLQCQLTECISHKDDSHNIPNGPTWIIAQSTGMVLSTVSAKVLFIQAHLIFFGSHLPFFRKDTIYFVPNLNLMVEWWYPCFSFVC